MESNFNVTFNSRVAAMTGLVDIHALAESLPLIVNAEGNPQDQVEREAIATSIARIVSAIAFGVYEFFDGDESASACERAVPSRSAEGAR